MSGDGSEDAVGGGLADGGELEAGAGLEADEDVAEAVRVHLHALPPRQVNMPTLAGNLEEGHIMEIYNLRGCVYLG